MVMNKRESSDNTIKLMMLGIIFFIILVIIYTATIKNSSEILLIITALYALLLVGLNLIWVLKNKTKTNEMRRLILKEEINTIKKNPLEVYLIDKIWYHNKGSITYKQLYSSLLYEISEDFLIYQDSNILINENLNINNLSKINRLTLEMAFLNSVELKQPDKLKYEKIEKMQKDKISISIQDIKKNINENCKNRSIFYNMLADIKQEYFVDIENNNSALLTIFTWLCIIMEFLIGINFVNSANILNFYLPISLALILCILVTNKYRERVVLKLDKKDEISKILNYIRNIEKEEKNNIDRIFLYGLNKLDANNDVAKIFL